MWDSRPSTACCLPRLLALHAYTPRPSNRKKDGGTKGLVVPLGGHVADAAVHGQ